MYLFFQPKSPTEILKPMPQRRHASELLDFSAGFALFGVFHPAFIRLTLIKLNNCGSFSNVCWNVLKFTTESKRHHIYLIWQVFFSREQKSATPLGHETEWSYHGLPIFSARRALHYLYPQALCALPSFIRIKKSRWWPVEHLRYHGQIGHCEQSNTRMSSKNIEIYN